MREIDAYLASGRCIVSERSVNTVIIVGISLMTIS